MPSFIIIGYVWQVLGRGAFLPTPIREPPQKSPSWIGLILIDLQTLAKWFGFPHCWAFTIAMWQRRTTFETGFFTVLLFIYSCVFGFLCWFDFNSLICSYDDLSCICSNCLFFSWFLISLILFLSSTTPVYSSFSSNNFPLLTTSLRDTLGLIKQNCVVFQNGFLILTAFLCVYPHSRNCIC